ncbi:MAG: autotransporter assembly complex protein TamA [Desulfuromonadales bacterium]
MLLNHIKQLFFFGIVILITLNPAYAEEVKQPSVQLDISGVKDVRLDNVKAALALPPGIVRNGKVEERWLERFAGKVPKLVSDALQPFGLYQSETTVTIEQPDALSYRVVVKIDPGPQTIVQELTIKLTGEGSQEKSLRQLVRDFPLKKGDPLDHQLYEQGKLALRLETSNLGYLEGSFTTHVIRIDQEEDTADIELVLDTGPLFYFGETSFEDQSESYTEEFLRRFLSYEEGDIFSHKELHRSRLNLYAADRFDDVQMVPMMDEVVDRHVPVKVKLVPGKRRRLRPGIGYGTDTGARISLRYKNMHSGENPSAHLFDLILAERAQTFETTYTIPQAGSVDNNLIGTLGLRQEDLDTYTTRMFYLEAEQTHGLGVDKVGSYFLRYLYEDSNVGNEGDNVTKLIIPGVRYFQRYYDDPLNPKKGYQFRVELRGSFDLLLSDLTIGQVITAGSLMLPITRHLTLHPRVEAATTIKDNEFSQVPPSMRFFVGGDNSVRGYAYKSRGPKNSEGDVIGGEALLVGSLEAEYSLNDKWGLAVFYDAGSAFNLSEKMEFIQGAGVGVRRYTQVGPIKFDLATPVKDGNNHGFRIHFSVGFDI